MVKRINTNELSTCALDHRPLQVGPRQQYREIQQSILKRSSGNQDIDFCMSAEEILEISQRLASIRIADRQ